MKKLWSKIVLFLCTSCVIGGEYSTLIAQPKKSVQKKKITRRKKIKKKKTVKRRKPSRLAKKTRKSAKKKPTARKKPTRRRPTKRKPLRPTSRPTVVRPQPPRPVRIPPTPPAAPGVPSPIIPPQPPRIPSLAPIVQENDITTILNATLQPPFNEVRISLRRPDGLMARAFQYREGLQKPIPVVPNLDLCAGIPAIGHYRSVGYNLRKRLALVELNIPRLGEIPGIELRPQDIEEWHIPEVAIIRQEGFIEEAIMLAQPRMPEEILNTLFPALTHQSYREKFTQLQEMGNRVTAYILIHGRVEDPGNDSENHNIAFHPWVATWSGLRFSAPNVPMGIFGADGIEPANIPGAIAFGNLTPQNVSTHAGGRLDDMSPNNVLFRMTPGRQFSSFWSVAVSPDRQRLIIVYHLLANTHQAEQTIMTHIHRTTSTAASAAAAAAAIFMGASETEIENVRETSRLRALIQAFSPHNFSPDLYSFDDRKTVWAMHTQWMLRNQ